MVTCDINYIIPKSHIGQMTEQQNDRKKERRRRKKERWVHFRAARCNGRRCAAFTFMLSHLNGFNRTRRPLHCRAASLQQCLSTLVPIKHAADFFQQSTGSSPVLHLENHLSDVTMRAPPPSLTLARPPLTTTSA